MSGKAQRTPDRIHKRIAKRIHLTNDRLGIGLVFNKWHLLRICLEINPSQKDVSDGDFIGRTNVFMFDA